MSIGAETAATLNIYRRLVGASVRTQLQFRTSLIMETVSAFAIAFSDFIEILVIFGHLPSLGTWSVAEVGFLYGAAGIGFALCDWVIGSIERIGEMVRSGRFDTIMLRPAGTLVQIAGADLALRRLGKLAQALIVFVVASNRLHIAWDLRRVGLVFMMVISAALIYISVFLVTAAVQFWIIGGSELGNALTYGGGYFTSYPLPIFGIWLRRLLAYVIPLAFCAYLPALAVLDKPDELGLPTWLQYASPAVAAVAFAVGYCTWRFGVRHYRSTGS